jgi:hypothetical protein
LIECDVPEFRLAHRHFCGNLLQRSIVLTRLASPECTRQQRAAIHYHAEFYPVRHVIGSALNATRLILQHRLRIKTARYYKWRTATKDAATPRMLIHRFALTAMQYRSHM